MRSLSVMVTMFMWGLLSIQGGLMSHCFHLLLSLKVTLHGARTTTWLQRSVHFFKLLGCLLPLLVVGVQKHNTRLNF